MANTNISEIYESFLSKISDYNLLSSTLMDEEIDEELFGYFKSARTKFYKCKNNLAIVEDITGEKTFSSELTYFEIEIITNLMTVEYLKPQILSSEVLKQSLSDKDFKIYSQANQLRELNLLYRMFKKEAIAMIVEYSYFGIEDEKL
jgi:hypothetical protein